MGVDGCVVNANFAATPAADAATGPGARGSTREAVVSQATRGRQRLEIIERTVNEGDFVRREGHSVAHQDHSHALGHTGLNFGTPDALAPSETGRPPRVTCEMINWSCLQPMMTIWSFLGQRDHRGQSYRPGTNPCISAVATASERPFTPSLR